MSRAIEFEQPATVDAILAAAGDSQEDVRRDVIPLLVRLAEMNKSLPAAAEAANDRLVDLLHDDVTDIRIDAASEFADLWTTDDGVVVLEQLLRDPSGDVRKFASNALSHHEDLGVSAATIAKLLDDPDRTVRSSVAFDLSRATRHDIDAALDALVRAAGHETSAEVRLFIASTLGELCKATGTSMVDRHGPHCAAAADSLYRLLADR